MSIFDRICSRPPGSKVSSISDGSIASPRKVKSGDLDTDKNSSSSIARSDSHPDSQDPGSHQDPDPTGGSGSPVLNRQLIQMARCVDDSRVQSLNDLGDTYRALEKTYQYLRGSVERQNHVMSDIAEQMNDIKDHYQRIDTEREHAERNLADNFPDTARTVFRQKPLNRHRINTTLTPLTKKSKDITTESSSKLSSKSKRRRGSQPKRRKAEKDCVNAAPSYTLPPSTIVPTKFTTSKQGRS